MGAFTQKSPGILPLPFPHLGDKKTHAPNHCSQLGISNSSFLGAKTIRLALIVNRLSRPVVSSATRKVFINLPASAKVARKYFVNF
jgi:hypothetical protein